MRRKIFISYKYNDANVAPLLTSTNGLLSSTSQQNRLAELLYPTTARNYATKLQQLLEYFGHIDRSENEDEDLSHLSELTIEAKLRDRIYGTTITIILISPEMREIYKPENKQWIPWEISYSLKEHERNGRTSGTNALIALVLPDRNHLYKYFVEESNCPYCRCLTVKTEPLFRIIKENMFNERSPNTQTCHDHSQIHYGQPSYIHWVKWTDFVADINSHIMTACDINDSIDDYILRKVP